MTTIACPICNSSSPDDALYCQACGQPIRCKACNMLLLPTAQACIRCGAAIPERVSQTPTVGQSLSIPPGYNHLTMRQTSDELFVDYLFTDATASQSGDLLANLRPVQRTSHATSVANEESNAGPEPLRLDNTPMVSGLVAAPLLPSQSSESTIPTTVGQSVQELFLELDGKFVPNFTRLKATSKKDYTIRVVYLYLYCREVRKGERASRAEIYEALEEVNVKDTNTHTYISLELNVGLKQEGDYIRLNASGREKAQKYLKDLSDTSLPDTWYPGVESQGSNSHARKGVKRQSNGHGDDDTALETFLTSEAIKQLTSQIEHAKLVALPLGKRGLFGLYAISCSGISEEVSHTFIAQCLVKGFDAPVDAESLRKSLAAQSERKPEPVIHTPHKGFRITPSGKKLVEDALQLRSGDLSTPQTPNQSSLFDENGARSTEGGNAQ